MKKTLLIFLVALIFLLGMQFVQRENIIERGDHYTISQRTVDRQTEYTVSILNEKKTVLKTFVCRTNIPPTVAAVDEGTLSVQIPHSAYSWRSQYFDIASSTFSDFFDSPVAAGFGRVAMLERKRGVNAVVVRDLYTGTALLAVACDFARFPSLTQAIGSAAFEDAQTLAVTYLSADGRTVSETFLIPLQ